MIESEHTTAYLVIATASFLTNAFSIALPTIYYLVYKLPSLATHTSRMKEKYLHLCRSHPTEIMTEKDAYTFQVTLIYSCYTSYEPKTSK